ncbi:uncharacterized protein CC84DRAFT_1080822 [Paraphaeosphaeria sporulosa]|uniref:Small nuclear ribonucleoprotein Prp3 C-terminal domain-containing protein n=1 Tax=Paraphaeosphaeria sporulosa TaxID=1460663 RepID=A0A177CW04_9PLEO|nr:uncharacterized protein CC84DRAFT_1080822 [Paraphaeosphaeria sporulosa]OAG11744.1 hypothetical protein CC84DRAFT_1080822 [Paraphaeosphaeria sporulosa]
MDKPSQDTLNLLKAGIENNTLPIKNTFNSSTITLLLNLEISETTTLQLDINIPFAHQSEDSPEEAPLAKIRIRQPPWLNRAATSQLNAQVSETDDLFTAIDDIKQAASDLLQSQLTLASQSNPTNSQSDSAPLVRAWFYFPSISTRSKRDDFIIHAPSYKLTGFLFAGKPGLLCLEGTSTNIDAYMKFIKTESWGDIPSHHKKVSERLREEGDEEGEGKGIRRVFEDMREITDEVGERRGARANRGDMGAVEGWLGERGLGEALGRVLM